MLSHWRSPLAIHRGGWFVVIEQHKGTCASRSIESTDHLLSARQQSRELNQEAVCSPVNAWIPPFELDEPPPLRTRSLKDACTRREEQTVRNLFLYDQWSPREAGSSGNRRIKTSFWYLGLPDSHREYEGHRLPKDIWQGRREHEPLSRRLWYAYPWMPTTLVFSLFVPVFLLFSSLTDSNHLPTYPK